MIIPYQQLAPETLTALLEDYVTRDGTDYGEVEQSLEIKVEQVRQLLARKEVVIAFDPHTETVGVITAQAATLAESTNGY